MSYNRIVLDQRCRTCNFRARNERIETGVIVKSHKVKNVSVERQVGECYQWKATGQCSRADSCSLSHGSNRGQKAQSSSPTPEAPTQTDGRKPSKGFWPKRTRSFWKERPESVQKFPQRTVHGSGDHWHPPACQKYISVLGCKFGDKCLFRHTEAGSPVKKVKENCEKDQLPY